MIKKSNSSLWIRILFPLPFIIGVLGYRMAGFNTSDSFYGSLCYYFVSVYYNYSDNWLMELARWTAPLMTVTGVVYSVKTLLKRTGNRITSLKRNSTAIYYDSNTSYAARALKENLPNSLMEEIKYDQPVVIHSHASNQILFLDNDSTNLQFYDTFKDYMKNSKVYLKLDTFDSELFASADVEYIQIPDLIAFIYWAKYPILDLKKGNSHEYHLAIIGSNELAQRILIHALHDNIYFQKQSFVYHIYGESRSIYKDLYSSVAQMNDDRVIYEDKEWFESYEELSIMDRIILTDRDNSLVLEKLIYKCGNVPIHYFALYDTNPAQYFRAKNIQAFGEMRNVLTRSNIMNRKLIETSKEIHFLYVNKNPNLSEAERKKLKDEEWQKLDGFMQSSYNALTSFFYNYVKLLNLGHDLERDPEAITRIEHKRWCRFYLKSFWTYGIPENGEARDSERKIHRALIPYDQLCEEDKERERKRVQFLIDIYHSKYGN